MIRMLSFGEGQVWSKAARSARDDVSAAFLTRTRDAHDFVDCDIQFSEIDELPNRRG
jgi:hypothetical protein